MPRIGFIVSEFPRPVDAYLLRELLALVEGGLDVRIYSLRQPSSAAAPRAAAAAAMAHLTGLPWSFGGHASDIYIDATNLPAKLRSAHFVTTCTEESRRYLLGLAPDVDPARVHTIYHGIDLSHPALERVEVDGLTVLAVGTLRDCKGFDTLLRAVARVRSEGTPARVIIVGDGEERPRLERLARRLGIAGRVAFTGYVPHEELARFYAVATLLVHPAHRANHFGIP